MQSNLAKKLDFDLKSKLSFKKRIKSEVVETSKLTIDTKKRMSNFREIISLMFEVVAADK
jgi:hypothetical protein